MSVAEHHGRNAEHFTSPALGLLLKQELSIKPPAIQTLVQHLWSDRFHSASGHNV